MHKPSALEKITASLATKSAFAAIAAVSGTPLAALLPVLGDSLAGKRHEQRVLAELGRLEAILMGCGEQINALSDAQYKLINEIVLAVLQNTEAEKIQYLRCAIENGLDANDITHTQSAQVARALRDITAGELSFLLDHLDQRILIGPLTEDLGVTAYVVDRNSEELIFVSGLIGLGVLVPAGSTVGDGGTYVFSGFCHLLKTLCGKTSPI